MRTISPVTRIEGHLGVSLETTDGRISRATVAGEMFRGFEVLLRGRDPLDAQRITQSICGVCPIEHGTASIFAQDVAYALDVPANGRLLRNLIQAGNFIASHLTHFYLLAGLDFADVAAVVDYGGGDPGLQRLREFARAQLAGDRARPAAIVGPLAPFAPQIGTERLCRDATLNASLLAHYCECVGLGQPGIKALAHKMVAVFSGKIPHAATLVPGGVTEQVTAFKVEQFRASLQQVGRFVEAAYWPDALAVAAAFRDYAEIGRGPADYLAYGAFPENDGTRFLPGGIVRGGTLEKLDVDAITEDLKYARFGGASGLHPRAGATEPQPQKSGAYSWLKAPRYRGRVMEVGPLARMLVAYHSGHADVRQALATSLQSSGLGLDQLNSVLGRHLARAIETRLLVARCHAWLDQLEPDRPTAVSYTIPATATGIGLTEAARGALGHWISIEGGRIANYQCVVPTTWNCSPRDDRDQPGALEQALVGTPNPNPNEPIEAMRVVRSFDPCMACAVH